VTPPQSLTRERVAALLAAHAGELRALGVLSLDLFGSVARGEARPDSDVDLLVRCLEEYVPVGNTLVAY
jgi:predicted nucleotidyltransferase